MNKSYARINWENYPSTDTPLNEENLNKIDFSVDEIDNRVITLDTTKITQNDVANTIVGVSVNPNNGIFTFERKNGSTFTIDTNLEKIADTLAYNPATQKLVIVHKDGTEVEVDLSALITQSEFVDSDTISCTIGSDGKVSLSVKNGSITADKLQQDYLADIQVEVANANAYAQSAQQYSQQSSGYAQTASDYADTANSHVQEAEAKVSAADEKATLSKSWAIGGTGTREGEETDNAKYYCQIAQQQSVGIIDSLDSTSSTVALSANQGRILKGLVDNVPTKTGTGASGTWDINITGSAGSVAWSSVSGKPNSMPASDVSAWAKASSKPSYTKSEVGLSNVGNYKSVSVVASQGLTDTEKSNARANIGAGTSNFDGNYSSLSGKPSSLPASDVSAWAKASTKPSYTKSEVGLGNVDNTADSAKRVSYANSAGGVAWSNVSGKPSSMPASDVSSWAKASTKPSYSASEISAGTFTGQVACPAGTDYTTNRMRNLVLTTTDPGANANTSYANGSIICVYE